MDPQQNVHFISLLPGMAPSRGVSQAPPFSPGMGATLSPMMIPLATSDAMAMSSFSNGQPTTISMIETLPTVTRAQMMMSQGLAPHPDMPVSAPSAPVQPPVHFYKCSTGTSLDEITHKVSERNKGRASLDSLQKAYTELNSRKIKDPLSSFLPDIPGDFDSSEPPGTMLLDLVENKPIGGKEFLPLSGQALLGFRLLPGPLPEQFRIDPPSTNDASKPRKKKKHKRKNLDRSEDKTDTFYSTPKQSKLPSDAYSFIKHESHIVIPTADVLYMGGGGGGGVMSGVGGGAVSAGSLLQQQQVYAGAGPAHLAGAAAQQPKKKKKRDKDKKKKDKKKRRHHNPQDAPVHPSHTVPHPHHTPPPPSSSSTSLFTHPHS